MKFPRILAMAIAFVIGALSQSAAGLAQTAPGAPSAEALQAARELASLTSVSVIRQTTTMLNDQVWPTVEAALRARNPMIDSATVAELRNEYENLQTSATVQALGETGPIYARYFTTEELQQLIAFYRTPVGAKTLTLMPRVSVEVLQSMTSRLQSLPQTINQRFSAILQQRGYKP